MVPLNVVTGLLTVIVALAVSRVGKKAADVLLIVVSLKVTVLGPLMVKLLFTINGLPSVSVACATRVAVLAIARAPVPIALLSPRTTGPVEKMTVPPV